LVSLVQRSTAVAKRPSVPLRARPRRARAFAQDNDLAFLIGDRVEGLLSNLARRVAASGQTVAPLADAERLLPSVSAELIERLGVNPYDAPEFLGELHRDLTAFAAVPRVRSWGTLVSTRGKLALHVPDGAGRPDFKELLESRWTVTR
jgi:hypothetical protein